MKIILAVTGSIASYKSYDVARLLVKKGHAVKVILTSGALQFIKPETFRYLGVESVFLPSDDFSPSHLTSPETVLHVELAKWADKVVVAPLSANTLSRLALGLNNDLLVSLLLAMGNKPLLLFPAMNTQMWLNPRIKEHAEKLKGQPNTSLVNPVSGLLACGDVGEGKFPDVEAVVDLIETLDPLKSKKEKILITAGATAAPLDPVRYLTNPSSGRMGFSIAKVFLSQGYQVTVLAGHNCLPQIENLKGHPNFSLEKTPTTATMRNAALKHFPSAHLYISTGAIADIEFDTAGMKLKKEAMGSTLPFHQAPDILKEVLEVKKAHQKVVSFAAETDTATSVFMEKMKKKPVNLMIGNKVANGLIGDTQVVGFQQDAGEYYFVETTQIKGPMILTKNEIGTKILNWLEGTKTW